MPRFRVTVARQELGEAVVEASCPKAARNMVLTAAIYTPDALDWTINQDEDPYIKTVEKVG